MRYPFLLAPERECDIMDICCKMYLEEIPDTKMLYFVWREWFGKMADSEYTTVGRFHFKKAGIGNRLRFGAVNFTSKSKKVYYELKTQYKSRKNLSCIFSPSAI